MSIKETFQKAAAVGAMAMAGVSAAPTMEAETTHEETTSVSSSFGLPDFSQMQVAEDCKLDIMGIPVDTKAFKEAQKKNKILRKSADVILTQKYFGLILRADDGVSYQIYTPRNQIRDKRNPKNLDVFFSVAYGKGVVRPATQEDVKKIAGCVLNVANEMDNEGLIDLAGIISKAADIPETVVSGMLYFGKGAIKDKLAKELADPVEVSSKKIYYTLMNSKSLQEGR